MQRGRSPFDLIKGAMNMGLLLGFFNIIKFVVMVVGIGSVSLTSLANAMTLAVPLVLFLLMRRYRKMAGNEALGISTMWSFGTTLTLFGSMLSGVVEYLYYARINPQFIATQMENAKSLIGEVATTGGDSVITQLSEAMGQIGAPTAIQMVMQSIWLSFILGSVLSLILAPIVVAVCKREVKK